jgi:hypothetical protein
VRVANRPNTYLLLLSGTELHDNEQATGLLEDFLELENSSPSLHREWAKYALRSAKLPPGSRLILAGHSLGGMVAQHLALDGQIWSEFQLRPERVILFGSPNVAPRVDGARYVYVEHAGDLLLNRFNREHQILGGVIHSDRGRIRVGGDFREVKVSGGGGTPDPLWGYHSLYHQNLALKNYDLQGAQLNGRRGAECLQLDLDFSFSYTAPNLDNIQNRVSETIGEIGMEKEAQRLRYEQLLPPSRASNRRQGYDGVYWDTKAHAIVIGEAKGGGAVLGTGYGFRQGTIEWARAAARAITRSRTANNLEVRWAEMILCSLGDYDVYGPVNPSSRGYFCSSLGPCKPPVRVELFTTENKNGLPGRTTHKVLARYP